ncbi:MAG TPA: flagellar basal body L-ring protein FlgH [Planctomycetota bacterium]|nr:flagellar basal body L-ring protein FlgH [Planctomycetota bacterium]
MSLRPSLRLAAALAAASLVAPAQSLWNPDRPLPALCSDLTAQGVGDLLTILVVEQQTVKNKEATELKRDASLDAALTSFNVLPDAFNTLPGVAGSASRDFKGDAKYDKEGSFSTTLTVQVLDMQPNGNLVVEGRRTIIIDGETKTMRITGIVRRYDVSASNTVRSTQVANASIAYEGAGTLTDATNRGWLGDLLDFIWPF